MLTGAAPSAGRLGLLAAGLLAWVLVLAVCTAAQIRLSLPVPGRLAAATARSIAVGEQIAAALEAYQVETGAFPAAGNAQQLAGALAPFLPAAALALAAPGSPFEYAASHAAVHLRCVPAATGVSLDLTLTAGAGGTLTVGDTTVQLPW